MTDTNNDNYWCTRSVYEDGKYYVSYTCRRPGQGCALGPGQPPKLGQFRDDQGNIRLSIYDDNFSELATVDVTAIQTDPGIAGKRAYHRSSILKVGDRLYVTFDGPGGGWVQELIRGPAALLPRDLARLQPVGKRTQSLPGRANHRPICCSLPKQVILVTTGRCPAYNRTVVISTLRIWNPPGLLSGKNRATIAPLCERGGRGDIGLVL